MSINDANPAFRRLRIEDVKKIKDMINRNYKYMEEFYNPKIHRTTTKIIKSMLQDSRYLPCIMTLPSEGDRNEEIAGFFSLIMLEKQKAEISLVNVATQFRGVHLGEQLMNFAEAMAKEKGVKILEIHVIEGATKLVQWYEKLGFKKRKRQHWTEVETKERFNEAYQDFHFLLMEKKVA